jgi:dCTP diphosphatase
MPAFALQPASLKTREVAQHFADTVQNPVAFEQHDDLLPGEVLAHLRRFFPDGLAPFWGVVPGPTNSARFDRLTPGAGVAFYGSGRLYGAGRIAIMFDSEALAERLWGRDKDGRTWAHVYVLVDFHDTERRATQLRPSWYSCAMNLDDLQATLAAFAHERDWGQFHTPKNLVMALAGEVGELVALFQWLTPEQASAVMATPESADAVRSELADITSYLLRLADVLQVDLTQAVADKVALNKRRYPVALARGSAAKYDKLGNLPSAQ